MIFASPVGHRTEGFCTIGRALHASSSSRPAALWMAVQAQGINALEQLTQSPAGVHLSRFCETHNHLQLTPIDTSTSQKPVIRCE